MVSILYMVSSIVLTYIVLVASQTLVGSCDNQSDLRSGLPVQSLCQ